MNTLGVGPFRPTAYLSVILGAVLTFLTLILCYWKPESGVFGVLDGFYTFALFLTLLAGTYDLVETLILMPAFFMTQWREAQVVKTGASEFVKRLKGVQSTTYCVMKKDDETDGDKKEEKATETESSSLRSGTEDNQNQNETSPSSSDNETNDLKSDRRVNDDEISGASTASK